jgi:hypothetical protein
VQLAASCTSKYVPKIYYEVRRDGVEAMQDLRSINAQIYWTHI